MVRWKQAKIYQDRRDRKDTITILEAEAKMTQSFLDKIASDKSAESWENLGKEVELEEKKHLQFIISVRTPDRDPRWGPIEPIHILIDKPKFGEQLQRVKASEDSFKEKCQAIVKDMKARIEKVTKEIDRLQEEASRKLTSENMYKEGFSKTVAYSCSLWQIKQFLN